jgi:hypothetical protein
MPFVNYTIVPEDGVVVVDGLAAYGVDMTGIPSNVHAICWYGARGAGTIEYNPNPSTGILPAPGNFSNASQYITQVNQAELIIEAAQNPITYYSTVEGNLYDGITYTLGDSITVNTPDTPQPPNTTLAVPPTPSSFQELYWYDSAWVISSVDPSLSLSEAKNVLNTAVETSAALQGATQARVYSPVQLFAAPDVTVLQTADYSGMDLGEYQTYLDSEVSSMQAIVNSAVSVPSLYGFDPNVDGNPNP